MPHDQPGRRFAGTTVPDPGFAGDDGAADPSVTRALAAYAEDPDDPVRYAAALTALAGSRLLVPVVSVPVPVASVPVASVPVASVLGEAEVDEEGLTHDKFSEMAAVLLTGRDGRQALLAFTCTDAMSRWRADARPVPVVARDAARAALHDGAAALVVDVAGPATVVVAGRPLSALAGDGR